ncbi:hypothetical protein KY308_02890 [Candidatus Woesearchaeota archaeon]|nr:hypothetical protein [Candidatus Woesearchaeota archaeon]
MRVYLEDVPKRYAFYVKSGEVLLNVEDLAKVLESMEQHIFDHHVTPERNDFHSWVRDIVLDIELAEQILCAKNAEEAKKIIKNRIAFIKKNICPVKKKAAKPKKKAAKKPVKKKASKKKK